MSQLAIAPARPYPLLQRFRDDNGGTIAVLFGMALIAVIACAGLALDLGRSYNLKNRLQSALDAATLAVAADSTIQGLEERKAVLQRYLNANLPEEMDGSWELKSFGLVDGKFQAKLEGKLPTFLMSALGFEVVTVSTANSVVPAEGDFEIAMVLDVSGSMNYTPAGGGSETKFTSLKRSAQELVFELEKYRSEFFNIKYAIVPFALSVNPKEPASFDPAWLDNCAQSGSHGSLFNNRAWGVPMPRMQACDPAGFAAGTARANYLDLFARLGPSAWRGCIEARVDPSYMANDYPADPSNPETLLVPLLWPDEEDGASVPSNYLVDGAITGPPARRNGAKYEHPTYHPSRSADWANRSCVEPLMSLTEDADDVAQKLEDLTTQGAGTMLTEGLAWGWRALSPNWYSAAEPYDTQNVTKIAIFLTDGTSAFASANSTKFSPYGYLSNGRIGTTNETAFFDILDSRFAQSCTEMKAQGIQIFSIGFDVGSAPDVQTLLSNCASGAGHYFDAESKDTLDTAFRSITKQISQLRIAS